MVSAISIVRRSTIGEIGFLYPKAFHDITVGNNSFGGITGFDAHTGWDATTGWGSPNASGLLHLLAQYSNPADRNNL